MFPFAMNKLEATQVTEFFRGDRLFSAESYKVSNRYAANVTAFGQRYSLVREVDGSLIVSHSNDEQPALYLDTDLPSVDAAIDLIVDVAFRNVWSCYRSIHNTVWAFDADYRTF